MNSLQFSKISIITIFVRSREGQRRKANGSREEVVTNLFERIEEFLIATGAVINVANKLGATSKNLKDILVRILLKVLQEFMDHFQR